MCHFLIVWRRTYPHSPYRKNEDDSHQKIHTYSRGERETVNNQQHFPLLYVCCLSLSVVLLFHSKHTHVGTKCVWCIGLWIFLFLMPLALLSPSPDVCVLSSFSAFISFGIVAAQIMNGFLCSIECDVCVYMLIALLPAQTRECEKNVEKVVEETYCNGKLCAIMPTITIFIFSLQCCNFYVSTGRRLIGNLHDGNSLA